MKSSGVTKMVSVVIVSLFLVSGGLAIAQSKQNQGLPWDALVEFSGGSFAAGIGFSWGSGKLIQAGKEYPLKIEGLSVGSVGITKATAYGKLFKLKKLEDVNGTYTAIGAGATVGGGGGGVTMQNSKGVILDLYTTTEGVSFTLGAGGVTLKLQK